MKTETDIKGILVTFFRDGTKGDYLEALNTATSELTALIEPDKTAGSVFSLSEDDENLKKVRKKYGKTHTIEAVKGTHVVLAELENNQSVCWGDGKTYYFRLTKI